MLTGGKHEPITRSPTTQQSLRAISCCLNRSPRKGVARAKTYLELVSGWLWPVASGSKKHSMRFCSLTIEYEERETWAAKFCWMRWYFPFTSGIRYETSADTFFENVTNTGMISVIPGVFKIMFSSIRDGLPRPLQFFSVLIDRKSVTQSPH